MKYAIFSVSVLLLSIALPTQASVNELVNNKSFKLKSPQEYRYDPIKRWQCVSVENKLTNGQHEVVPCADGKNELLGLKPLKKKGIQFGRTGHEMTIYQTLPKYILSKDQKFELQFQYKYTHKNTDNLKKQDDQFSVSLGAKVLKKVKPQQQQETWKTVRIDISQEMKKYLEGPKGEFPQLIFIAKNDGKNPGKVSLRNASVKLKIKPTLITQFINKKGNPIDGGIVYTRRLKNGKLKKMGKTNPLGYWVGKGITPSKQKHTFILKHNGKRNAWKKRVKWNDDIGAFVTIFTVGKDKPKKVKLFK